MKNEYKPNVELIYDADCPNVEATRDQLRVALGRLELPLHWREWNRRDQSIPRYAARYGSPTVLVDGEEVTGLPPSDGLGSCRIYYGASGRAGVPPLEAIVAALEGRGGSVAGQYKWGVAGAVVSAIAASACCVLPLALLGVGVGGAWATRVAVLESYRPWLIAVAITSLTFAFYRAYRPAKAESCAPHGLCRIAASRAVSHAALWAISPLVLLLLVFPQLVRHLPAHFLPLGGTSIGKAAGPFESCCEAPVRQPASQASQPGREPPKPIDPTREIIFNVQNLQCPAVKGVGCGSMLAPLLAEINQIQGVSDSFSNWTGTKLRVLIAAGAGRDVVANKVQQVLVEDGHQPVRLDAKELTKALRAEDWYAPARLVDLSSYEFRTVAKRRLNAFADSEKLKAAQRQKLTDLVDQLWDTAAEGIDPPGPGSEDYGRYWHSRRDRFVAAYVDRARGVLTPEQIKALLRMYGNRQ